MYKLLTGLALIFSNYCSAQVAKIEGKVTDQKTGKPLTGVSVVQKGSTRGASTDIDGRYLVTVKTDTSKKVTLVFSYTGTIKEVEGIEAVENRVNVQDVSITIQAKSAETVVIKSTSNARKETAASLITFQKNTNTVASVISAEIIKRSPDRNTGEILKRVAGISLQDGRFIVVRGLADRYNQAMLNGILLTSTEPDRKTFSFDLIPSQIIDNIVVNKAFVPEYPGEWAGGLIQVTTKDIPAKNFLNVQLGAGFNTQSTGKKYLQDEQAGKTDWLGLDDGTRALPASYPGKSNFDTIGIAGVVGGKTQIGKAMRNSWAPTQITAPLNFSTQINGGFVGKLFKKKIGGTFAISYSKNYKNLDLINRINNIDSANVFGILKSYNDRKYIQETILGGLAGMSVQLNSLNRISGKVLLNINGASSVLDRVGYDNERPKTLQRGNDFIFRQNTFFSGQLNGEHGLSKALKLKWYGAFNILDGYTPDQRRLMYERELEVQPWEAIISNNLSQTSGSRIYQNLSDYIYTGGGDAAYNFEAFSNRQSVKIGYMMQIKDRLYDAQLFANFLPLDNLALRRLPQSEIFAPQNFGNGTGALFGFDAIKNKNFRYMANTILNAGFVQFDNQFGKNLKAVWGLRVENYDQLIGSVKKYDPRHLATNQTDFLPGINLTYKLNNKTNLRLSSSQTVIRPELRELAALSLYDFELNAAVQGDPQLKRTKIFNTDFRYEVYPGAGEVISVGAFYKKFKDPIEQFFNEDGGGLFTYINPAKAYSYGIEIELRKKLDRFSALKNFTLQTNVSLIQSKVNDPRFLLSRPLQGQSNYLLNAGLLYDLEKIGLNVTTLFNMIGRRIYLVGGAGLSGSPNVWEKPRPLLDFQIAKKVISRKGEIKLNIADIINAKQIFYQNNSLNKDFEYNSKADALRFQRINGTTFNLTFNYTL
jgi:hypothetical protein